MACQKQSIVWTVFVALQCFLIWLCSFLCITSMENFHLSLSNSSTETSYLCSRLHRSTSWIRQIWLKSMKQNYNTDWMENLRLNFCFKLHQTIVNIWEQSLKKISTIGGVGIILNDLLGIKIIYSHLYYNRMAKSVFSSPNSTTVVSTQFLHSLLEFIDQ